MILLSLSLDIFQNKNVRTGQNIIFLWISIVGPTKIQFFLILLEFFVGTALLINHSHHQLKIQVLRPRKECTIFCICKLGVGVVVEKVH